MLLRGFVYLLHICVAITLMPNDHYAMVDIKLSYHGSFTPTILVKFTANWILRLLRYYYVTFFLHSFMRGPTLSYPCFGQNPGNRVNGRCPCVRSLQNKKKKKKISIRNGHLMTWNFCVCNLLPLTRLPSKFRLCLLSRPFFFFFFETMVTAFSFVCNPILKRHVDGF